MHKQCLKTQEDISMNNNLLLPDIDFASSWAKQKQKLNKILQINLQTWINKIFHAYIRIKSLKLNIKNLNFLSTLIITRFTLYSKLILDFKHLSSIWEWKLGKEENIIISNMCINNISLKTTNRSHKRNQILKFYKYHISCIIF